MGVACVRGPEDDVVTRFALAVAAHPADEIVRLTADCPLTDPGLVEAVLDLRRRTGADYAGNTPIRTFPDGLDVEVMTAEAFATVDAEATDPLDREHVTRFLLQRPDRFRLANLRAPVTLAAERWTVDTAADLARVREIVDLLPDPVTATWEQVLAVAGTTTDPHVDVVQPDVVADQLLQEA
jgi:spore coat polysaccharide biosynthesis protein SpsF